MNGSKQTYNALKSCKSYLNIYEESASTSSGSKLFLMVEHVQEITLVRWCNV